LPSLVKLARQSDNAEQLGKALRRRYQRQRQRERQQQRQYQQG